MNSISQLSAVAPFSFKIKKLGPQLKISDLIPEKLKPKIVIYNRQTEACQAKLSDVKNKTIIDENSTIREGRTNYDKHAQISHDQGLTHRLFEKNARSASPHQQEKSREDQSNNEKIKKTRNINQAKTIRLFERYKDLEEIWNKNANFDIDTIDLCLEIIYCLHEYSQQKKTFYFSGSKLI